MEVDHDRQLSETRRKALKAEQRIPIKVQELRKGSPTKEGLQELFELYKDWAKGRTAFFGHARLGDARADIVRLDHISYYDALDLLEFPSRHVTREGAAKLLRIAWVRADEYFRTVFETA